MFNFEHIFMYFGIVCFIGMFVYIFWQIILLNKFKKNTVDRINEIYHAIEDKASQWRVNDMDRHLDRLSEEVWTLRRELHPEKNDRPGDVCYTGKPTQL